MATKEYEWISYWMAYKKVWCQLPNEPILFCRASLGDLDNKEQDVYLESLPWQASWHDVSWTFFCTEMEGLDEEGEVGEGGAAIRKEVPATG
jgi:hypothetical protein